MDAVRRFADLDAFPAKQKERNEKTTYRICNAQPLDVKHSSSRVARDSSFHDIRNFCKVRKRVSRTAKAHRTCRRLRRRRYVCNNVGNPFSFRTPVPRLLYCPFCIPPETKERSACRMRHKITHPHKEAHAPQKSTPVVLFCTTKTTATYHQGYVRQHTPSATPRGFTEPLCLSPGCYIPCVSGTTTYRPPTTWMWREDIMLPQLPSLFHQRVNCCGRSPRSSNPPSKSRPRLQRRLLLLLRLQLGADVAASSLTQQPVTESLPAVPTSAAAASTAASQVPQPTTPQV